MVQPSEEVDLRGLEWVVCREVNIEEEYTTLKRTVWRSHDSRLPVKQVVPLRSSATVSRGVFPEIQEFFVNSFECHTFQSTQYMRNLAR